MTMEKVAIISNVNGPIGVTLPNIRFDRTWASRGTKISVDREVLEEMRFDPGANYMLETGMLYIEDMDVKKEIGLEPDDATEPVNIIVLSDEQRKEYLTDMPLWKFKQEYPKLGWEEAQNLADYAIMNELMPSMDKCDLIQKTIGKDIISAIRNDRLAKED